jgi:hypothetical protein
VDVVENDNYSGQLRALRFILAENFRPLSTAKLAKLTHIEHVAIRGVESGRRKLSASDYCNIMIFLGARWNPDSRQWVRSTQPAIPYTRADFELYQTYIESRQFSDAYQNTISQKLTSLLASLEPKQASTALLRLNYLLDQIAAENNRILEPGWVKAEPPAREAVR